MYRLVGECNTVMCLGVHLGVHQSPPLLTSDFDGHEQLAF